ncbi:DUF2147 domain-containing protein [Methylocystis sp.]|uniref:DUF2147 domain-containing protein n=1 Tax=Methylocystis sp. TaxID=1911079 RepID=UPI003D0F3B7C
MKTVRVFDLSWRKSFAVVFLAVALAPPAQAGGEPYGVWLRPEGGQQFSFYDCGGLLCAKLISVRNAEEQHAVGTVILRGASKSGPREWRGKLYNTKDGNIYDGVIALKSANELTLKGCLWRVLCKSETWRRAGAKAQSSGAEE